LFFGKLFIYFENRLIVLTLQCSPKFWSCLSFGFFNNMFLWKLKISMNIETLFNFLVHFIVSNDRYIGFRPHWCELMIFKQKAYSAKVSDFTVNLYLTICIWPGQCPCWGQERWPFCQRSRLACPISYHGNDPACPSTAAQTPVCTSWAKIRHSHYHSIHLSGVSVVKKILPIWPLTKSHYH